MVFNRGMSNADRHQLIAKAVKDSGRATVPELAGLTGAQNTASRRLLERQGFRVTDQLPDTGQVRYTLNLS